MPKARRNKKARRIKNAERRRRFSRQMNENDKTPRCGNTDIQQSRSRRNGRFIFLKSIDRVL